MSSPTVKLINKYCKNVCKNHSKCSICELNDFWNFVDSGCHNATEPHKSSAIAAAAVIVGQGKAIAPVQVVSKKKEKEKKVVVEKVKLLSPPPTMLVVHRNS